MNKSKGALRFPKKRLSGFVSQLFQSLKLPMHKSDVVARILVEADLLGHVTHGLQLCPSYLEELEAGKMEANGEHDVIKDSGVAAVWDGRYLPGCWLTQLAVEGALEKAKNFPAASRRGLVIQKFSAASRRGFVISRILSKGRSGDLQRGGLNVNSPVV